MTTNRGLAEKINKNSDLAARKIEVKVLRTPNYSIIEFDCQDVEQLLWLLYHQGFEDGQNHENYVKNKNIRGHF